MRASVWKSCRLIIDYECPGKQLVYRDELLWLITLARVLGAKAIVPQFCFPVVFSTQTVVKGRADIQKVASFLGQPAGTQMCTVPGEE